MPNFFISVLLNKWLPSVWRIRRTGDNRYQGTAGDIEGVASGQAAGNAFHWRYSMNVEASGSRWLLHFDDWMFLQDGSHLFNKTEMATVMPNFFISVLLNKWLPSCRNIQSSKCSSHRLPLASTFML